LKTAYQTHRCSRSGKGNRRAKTVQSVSRRQTRAACWGRLQRRRRANGAVNYWKDGIRPPVFLFSPVRDTLCPSGFRVSWTANKNVWGRHPGASNPWAPFLRFSPPGFRDGQFHFPQPRFPGRPRVVGHFFRTATACYGSATEVGLVSLGPARNWKFLHHQGTACPLTAVRRHCCR